MPIANDNIWEGAYKIPWHEPCFSERMLREHLSQEHDLASRRAVFIDRQVAWIHVKVFDGKPGRILDLGCGPGTYSHRLSMLGHQCVGIDFGPASIAYANEHKLDNASCKFILGDLRDTDFGGPFDLVMLLYGELNVFSPTEVKTILRKSCASLTTGGCLIIEPQTPESIESMGQAEPTEQTCETSVFSGKPHRWRTEATWLPSELVAIQQFTITDLADGRQHLYHSTNQCWPDTSLIAVLEEAGFTDIRRCKDWPCNTEALTLWRGRKA